MCFICCVCAVWSQFILVSLWPLFGQPRPSAGTRNGCACRVQSLQWLLTRSSRLQRNEPWRLRREPCGEQLGKANSCSNSTMQVSCLVFFSMVQFTHYLLLILTFLVLLLYSIRPFLPRLPSSCALIFHLLSLTLSMGQDFQRCAARSIILHSVSKYNDVP